MYFLLLSLVYLTHAGFKSYDGTCGFVYDATRGASYPLDVCITDYDASKSYSRSRIYECEMGKDGHYDIEVYTYYGSSCTGNYSESRSALDPDKNATRIFNCGGGDGNNSTECYVEYKNYTTTATNCEGYDTASYSTEFIIVGTCVASGEYVYSRCVPDESNVVEYVKFNDKECCDLSYIYTGKEGPKWMAYDIKPGCNDGTYIDGWQCKIPDAANDPDVFTDNTDEMCTDDAYRFTIYGIMAFSVVIGAVF